MIILASVHWRKINGINFSHYETFTNTCTCILKIWLNHFKQTLKFGEYHSWTLLYNPHAVTDYLESEKRIAIRIISWSKYRDTYCIVRWVYHCSPNIIIFFLLISVCILLSFYIPPHIKWRGIMLYPPNHLSVRSSVRQNFVSGL